METQQQSFGGAFVRCMCGWQRGAKNCGHGQVVLEQHWAEAHGVGEVKPPKVEAVQSQQELF